MCQDSTFITQANDSKYMSADHESEIIIQNKYIL